jgi:hypothetical protein
VNAELVRGLIRMGFFVGVHMEHGHDVATLDEVVDALAAPIVQALGSDEVAGEVVLTSSGFAPEPCPSIHVAHGQCVLGGSRHVEHGTHDGGRRWNSWIDPKLETQ